MLEVELVVLSACCNTEGVASVSSLHQAVVGVVK